MKNFTKHFKFNLQLIVCVLGLLLGMVSVKAQQSASTAGFNISLTSFSYDAGTAKTTFIWRIQQNGSTTGLSHVDMTSFCLSGSVSNSEISADGTSWSSTTIVYSDGTATTCTKPTSLFKLSGDGSRANNYFRLTMNGRYDTTSANGLIKFGNGNPTTGNGYTTLGCSTFNMVVPVAVAKYTQVTKCQDLSTTNLTATSGAASYTWLSPDGSVTTTTDNQLNIANLSSKSGTYKVIYTKDNCKKSEIFAVTINGLPSAIATASNVECVNDINGSVTLSVSNGTPSYTYAWSNNATTKNISALGIGTYTVTVTDANGCSAQASSTVNAVDDIKPVVPVLSDITRECSVTVTAPTTTDNCAGTVTGTTSDPLTYNAQGTHTITWTFNDGHGNTSTATQKVIVKDVTAPVVPTLSDVTGECSATATAPTTTDNCAGTVTGTTSDPLTYSAQGTYTITWTFNDGNGNTSTATQKVIVKDVTAPVVPSLSDVTGECSATATTPTTTDNCAGIVTGTTSDPLTYSAQGTYTITWTFNDGNGNTSTAKQKVIVKDVTAPVVPSLSDVTGECSATATTPTTTDNCAGIVTGTTSDPLTYSAQGTYTITWTFNDGNGNTSTAKQKVIVKDITAPVVPILSDITGECSATAIEPTTTDNCAGTVTGTTSDPLTYSAQGTYTITWTFTDGNGNTSTATQKVIVKDVTAPVVPTLSDVTGECSATATAPTTTDNCAGTVTGTTSDALTYTTQGTHTITWTFNDSNGNTSTATQKVIVKDVTAPVVPTLSDVTGECSATATAPTTTDNCAGTVTGTTSDPLTYNTQGTYTITWTFNDGHGNTSTATQKVIVKDVTAPVVPTLSDVTGECSATATAPTTTDNCAGTVTGTTSDALTYTTQGTHTITWTFNDGNGNTSTATQKVIVKDVTAPVVPTLSDVTGECSAIATAPTTTDNCAGTVTGTTSDPLTYSAQGTYTITWTFTDGNGNTSTTTQKVIVKDVTAPVVPTLSDVTGECSATATAPTTTDNCAGTVTGTTTDPLTYTTQGTYTITWTFNDGNGNTSTATQKVIVKDVTAPIVPTLSDVTGECSATATAPTTTDNCAGTVTGTTSDQLNYTTQGTHIITWTFNDGNGNRSTSTQKVIVRDITAPTVICPANITTAANTTQLSVSGSVVNFTVTSTDNCGVQSVVSVPASGSFFPVGTTTVRTTVTDINGLTSTCSFTVTVTNCTPAITVSSIPTSNTYTGGSSTSLFLGYGAQSTVLNVATATPGSYTYVWSGSATNKLSSTNSRNPVFAPTTAGSYNFTVTVTNNSGCKATGNISICVTDIRSAASSKTEEGEDDGDKQTMCNHQAHDAYECSHKGHGHTCNHKAHMKETCDHKISGDSEYNEDKDCDHKAHKTSDCTHKGHNHKACDHKAHESKDCDHNSVSDRNNQKECDHKTHNESECSHNGHNHKDCDHTKHEAKECPHNGAKKFEDNNGNNYKVNLCHVPPGNPGMRITLSISVNAVAAHLANHPGDRLGTCDQQPCSAYLDITNPEIICPSAVSINCGASSSPIITGSASASDNAGYVEITYKDVSVAGTINRIWKATDASGNVSTCTQVITIVDNVKPVIKAPSNITINCGSSNTPASCGTATASDNCSSVTISYTDVTSGNTINRIWRAVDASGNYSTAVQTITIAPAFNVTLNSVPSNAIYTGGVNTNLFLGYGAQSTTLKTGSLSSEGNTYTYVWTGSNIAQLSSTSAAAPIFTPTASGSYTFNVTVTNKYGCTASNSITICVTDVRTAGGSVYVYHIPKTGAPQQLTLTSAQVAQHLTGDCKSDRLGTAAIQACSTVNFNSSSLINSGSSISAKTESTTIAEDGLNIVVMPNPSSTYFTLKLQSNDPSMISLRVMDAAGRTIDAKSQLNPNSTIQVGKDYNNGTYYAEMTQGVKRKVVQLVKIK